MVPGGFSLRHQPFEGDFTHILPGKAKCDPWAEDKRSLEFKREGWDMLGWGWDDIQ